MADDSVGRRMPFAFLAEVERRVRLLERELDRIFEVDANDNVQFTAMFSPDVIISAGAHSLDEFEPELSRVSCRTHTRTT